jgi:yeast amino acid transporter
MMVGLIILSVVLFFGGGPNHDRLGFRYWNNPGATKPFVVDGAVGRFVAFWSVMITCIFAYVFAPELIIVTAGEMQNPRKNLPIAARRYFYRLIFFYIVGALCIGVICPSDDSRLTSGGAGAGSSPWVAAIANAGISALPSIVNAVILLSAWSSGNSFLYMSSRSLYSLALSGNAPRIFKKCTPGGVPIYAVSLSSLFTLLAYLNVSGQGGVVFGWFINLTNTWGMISWICCCVVYLRFRKACIVQGVIPPYRHWSQPYGAWIALVAFGFFCLINGFTVFIPSRWSAANFLTAYVGIPVFLLMYLGHQYVYRDDGWARRPEHVDLTTGLQEIETQTEEALRSGWRKVWKIVE